MATITDLREPISGRVLDMDDHCLLRTGSADDWEEVVENAEDAL